MKKSKAAVILVAILAAFAGLAYYASIILSSTGIGEEMSIPLGLDLSGGVSITYQVMDENPSAEDMSDTIYKLQKRVESYSTEASVYQVGDDRIAVEIPGVTDASKILEELGNPGSLEFQLSDGTVFMTGDQVADAQAATTTDQYGNKQYVVQLTLTDEGAKTFGEVTSENVGKALPIVYDGEVISYPTVQEAITGGTAQISGQSTFEEAQTLATQIRIGSLSLQLSELESSVVGAQLGSQAISSSLKAAAIGLVIVMVFMIIVYAVPGVAAALALAIYTALVIATLYLFEITLTLPGIAGIILSIGMAVDANVLIYERTKEELRAGKGVKKALADGYSNAFSAIFDSNLTSIITGIILFNFGTGPIRGFATTLIIGILVSFFTAVFMTRLVYEHFMNKDKWLNLTFTSKISRNLLVNTRFDFMGTNKKSLIIVSAIILVCIGSFALRGLSQSIDFTGGRNFKVQFENPVEPEQVRELIADKFGEDVNVNVIAIGTDKKTVRISTNYRIADEGNNVDSEIESYLYETLKPLLTQNITLATFIDRDNHTGGSIVSSQKVGPSIADDIKTGAVWSVVLALIAIGLYILIRFRNIAYSIGSIVALTCDTIMIIGAYSLLWGIVPFSLEIDQTFIGAILTAIGYSINDKVVIFDRVREFFGLYPKRDKRQLFNDSLNTTLARTINTSLSTLIVLLCIFILGGDSIRSFAFAMILGVVIGTLSSLFIASPIAYNMMKNKKVVVPATEE